jgi:hypothetical protein
MHLHFTAGDIWSLHSLQTFFDLSLSLSLNLNLNLNLSLDTYTNDNTPSPSWATAIKDELTMSVELRP